MRTLYWSVSAVVALVVGTALYGWCCPESCVGQLTQATYDLGCRLNPLHVLNERAREHDAAMQAMDEDVLAAELLAQVKGDLTPCGIEDGQEAPGVLHLVGAIELPAPIVFKDEEPLRIVGGAIVTEKSEPTPEAAKDTKLLKVVYEEYDSVKESTARPMPTAEESLQSGGALKKMPYACEDMPAEIKECHDGSLLFGVGVNSDEGLTGCSCPDHRIFTLVEPELLPMMPRQLDATPATMPFVSSRCGHDGVWLARLFSL